MNSMPITPSSRRSARRRTVISILIVVALAGAAGGAAMLTGFLPYHVVAGDSRASGFSEGTATPHPVPVRVVHPKLDPSVQVTIEQLATVEAFFRADLRARASGTVKVVTKDIGDRVRQGDLLVVIDVPEFFQDIAQKESVVAQRRQEVRVARAQWTDAVAKREVAKAAIRQRQAETAAAEATAEFRRKRYERLKLLAARDTIGPDVLEEQEKEVKSADAAVEAAKVAVERASADLKEADARIDGALTDIDLKTAIVDVALRDLARARAVAEYARITSPFDGVIVRRTVDPGSFVQNATTGASEALISVVRTDMVTIAGRFTDAAAPFINDSTEAEITMNNVPGLSIRGKVTRFAPSVQNSDRTMRVEMDLFTGTEKEHRALVGRVIAADLSPLSATVPWDYFAAYVSAYRALSGLHKGDRDLLTAQCVSSLGGNWSGKLLPGMTGNMKLFLRQFQGGYVLPSSAVFSRSGRPYVLLVEDGVTRQYPVQVQVNDQRMAKVVLVKPHKDANGGSREDLVELTGHEDVVVSRQIEIGDGQAVKPALSSW